MKLEITKKCLDCYGSGEITTDQIGIFSKRETHKKCKGTGKIIEVIDVISYREIKP